MVNCKNCGAPLSLNDAFCPHCGTPNPEAQEHLKKLAKLDRDYRKTRSEVITEVKKTKKGYGLLIVLIVLMLANLIIIPFYGASYEIADRINASRYSEEETRAKMDELLEKGEYEEFYLYFDRYNVKYDQYREYNTVAYLSSYYSTVLNYLSDYLYAKESYSDPLLRLCSAMKDYQDDYEHALKREENETALAYIRDINDRFTKVIKSCLHYTDEDIEKISTLSSSELVVLTTERMNNEKEENQ
ncbi:MAG: zinc ribbon domain-containing protein [Erysipelotrichaceae bacterium]|nr:zinc ribbon domain-containing protein [Erysipelotrichaceae bacterium]